MSPDPSKLRSPDWKITSSRPTALHKDCFVVLQSVFVENSFSFVYTITAKNGIIDERPTTNILVVDETILTNEDFWWLIGYLGSVKSSVA
jgi:hypothetical protein